MRSGKFLEQPADLVVVVFEVESDLKRSLKKSSNKRMSNFMANQRDQILILNRSCLMLWSQREDGGEGTH